MKKYITLLAAAILLVVSACGNEEISTEEAGSGGSDESNMVPYTTDGGEEIEIPEDPQRIVVLATSYFGNLKQLDANVVGVGNDVENSEVLGPMTEDVELLEPGNVEQVMNLDPDLIITFASDENLDKLKAVAPTIPVDYNSWNYLDIHEELGRIVGKEEEAGQWVEDWEAELAEDKETVQQAVGEDATASVIEQYAKDIYVYGTNWGRGTEIIYQGLGLGVPQKIQDEVVESGWESISAEEIEEYAGDYMFVGSGDGGADNAYRDTAVWNNLDAVENDRVTEFDSQTFYYNDPYSLEHQKEIIVDALTK
ncbi:ABC transporter substrate-binding protein [Salinicoccus albus]|uniref:ABC transporter substrate-binding protein n=1 Tax=Salinicoccus albus TaxID=418756 RepID=UPI00035D676E|nr:ABC transporter substrate-binding protein [Salinicoccus albus]